MLLGVQVSTAGRIYEAFSRAEALGCNTMQIFSRNPQKWREKALSSEDIRKFNRLREKSDIKPIFIHIPYLVNLASPNPALYKASIKAYIQDIKEADALNCDYIVTHMGSHKKTSEKSGLKRLIGGLNIILEKTPASKVGLLLENTSGSGCWLGYEFSHQRDVLAAIKHKERLGLCVDTAHAYLAGYDIASSAGLEEMLNEIDSSIGVKHIKLIHLNDAKDKLGSHHDRHEHLGKGKIGLEGIKRIINHPLIKNTAFVLETPKDSEKADKDNLNTVKKLRAE